MARPYFSNSIALFSLICAFLAHGAIFGAAMLYTKQKSSMKEALFRESDNIIYAQYMETKAQNIQDNQRLFMADKNAAPSHQNLRKDQHAAALKKETALVKYDEAPGMDVPGMDVPRLDVMEKTILNNPAQPQPLDFENSKIQDQKNDPHQKNYQGQHNNQGQQKINRAKIQSARCQFDPLKSHQKNSRPAHLRIQLSASGVKNHISIIQSSGYKKIDQQILKIAQKAVCRPHLVDGIGQPSTLEIRFR